MLKDLELKQAHVDELLKQKDHLDVTIAPFASIHSIYVSKEAITLQKTFNEVQEEIKLEIKRHFREKAEIGKHLENLTQEFDESHLLIGR